MFLLFQRYALVLAACVLSLIVLSEFGYDLRLYLGLLACCDARCYGVNIQVINSFIFGGLIVFLYV